MKITQKGMNNHVSELIETLWNVNSIEVSTLAMAIP